jgi:hypothetical protein
MQSASEPHARLYFEMSIAVGFGGGGSSAMHAWSRHAAVAWFGGAHDATSSWLHVRVGACAAVRGIAEPHASWQHEPGHAITQSASEPHVVDSGALRDEHATRAITAARHTTPSILSRR